MYKLCFYVPESHIEEVKIAVFAAGAGRIGEYDSCCWGLRVVAKRFLRNREGDHRDALYIQLVLKGLGSSGRRAAPLFYDLAD